MSKEQLAKRKQEILASIKNPLVREHYRAQLDMAEELESEGIATAFHDTDMFREERDEVEHEAEEQLAEAVAEKLGERQGRRLFVAGAIMLAVTIVYALWRWL